MEKNYSVAAANQYIKDNRDKVIQDYRHHFHLMAPIGWINDPNGFIYFQGEYHLFYQFYPYGSEWGPMHWGHAKSKDLINWEELPVALAPDQPYDKDGCFSGSAIEVNGELVLMYTGHVVENDSVTQTQCMAFSADGIHFTKIKENPVIDAKILGEEGSINDFRDPKILRHNNTYYAIVATKTPDSRGKMVLFESKDSIDWTFKSTLLEGDDGQGIMWECPDFFRLDGYDVLIMSPIQIKKSGLSYHNVSSTMACVGQMDWETGKLVVENYHEIDYGFDFYAPQTLIDAKDRRIMIAWMQMWGRTMPTHDLNHGWAGAMTLPRELKVIDNKLVQKPIATVFESMEDISYFENISVTTNPFIYQDKLSDSAAILLECDLEGGDQLEIIFGDTEEKGLHLSYDAKQSLFTINRQECGHPIVGEEPEPLYARQVTIPLLENKLKLAIFRDTASLEIFINERETMTATFYEIEKSHSMMIKGTGKAELKTIAIGTIGLTDA